jgi:hypothetical protein
VINMPIGGTASNRFSHSPLGPLATVMDSAAEDAAVNLAQSQAHGLQFGEVTITESSLLTLVRHISELRVSPKADDKPEAHTGADFEFWIEGYVHWFSFVAQAKKMKLEGATDSREGVTTYDVGYEVGAAKTPQIDLLLNNPKPAVYVLYNTPGMGDSRGFNISLPNTYYVSQSCERAFLPFSDGITVVPGEAMKIAFQKTQRRAKVWKQYIKTSNKKHPHLTVSSTKAVSRFTTPRAFPWSCLAACPASSICPTLVPNLRLDGFERGVDVDNDPAYLVANAMYKLNVRAAEFEEDDWAYEGIQDLVEAGITSEVPAYVLDQGESDERVRIEDGTSVGSTADYVVILALDPELAERRFRDS